jgi:nitrate/nitrite-specific signal transduction histidine kinase
VAAPWDEMMKRIQTNYRDELGVDHPVLTKMNKFEEKKNMSDFIGTDEQLINALDHMTEMRKITQTERSICAEAAARLRIAAEGGQLAPKEDS